MNQKNKYFKYLINCNSDFKKPNKVIIKHFCDKIFITNNIFNVNISFIFCSDNFLLNLKKKYFNKNEYTDVIAFPINEINNKEIEGEIYISLDRALENSSIYNEPYEREVTRLIIHGCLHLIGFDDNSVKEKKNMTKMEDHFLNSSKWQGLFKN